MKIKQSEFIKSAPTLEHCPTTGFAEFAFAGRSNVGKSSLLNYLVNKKKLARTSSSPGRTQTFNYYLINNSFYFVDLPGYGYAKVSIDMRKKWRHEMERYMENRDQLKGVIQVTDIRHDATALDKEMANYLQHLNIPWLLVITKADKIGKTKQKQQALKIARELGMTDPNRMFVISSEKKFGGDSLINELANLI